MKLIKFLPAFIVIAIFCSWACIQNNDIKKATWLIGTWENKTTRGSLYETWAKVNDMELLGKSYMLKEKDTITFETVQLIQKDNSIFYIPIVKDQNNGQPVSFSLKRISDTEMVFENPAHDFPQVISYTKITTDSLVAEISGMRNGQLRKQTFPMKRVK